MAFRKPETSVETGVDGTMVVLVHPPEVKEPLPLTLHHLPVAVTYALFEGGNTIMVDPSFREEAAMQGSLTMIVNSSKEVCAVHKAGGVGVLSGQMMRCTRLAFEKVDLIVSALKGALEQHAVKRVAARVKRHRQVQSFEQQQQQPAKVESREARTSLVKKLGIDAMDFEEDDDEEDVAVHVEAVQASLEIEAPQSLPSNGKKKQAKLISTPQVQSSTENKKAISNKKPAKREREEVGLEGMEAIARLIAGVGNDEKEISILSEAIKKKPTLKK